MVWPFAVLVRSIRDSADCPKSLDHYNYDALGAVKDCTTTGASQSYLYDTNGNRTQLTSITGAASNRLLGRNVDGSVTNYTLDASGNLTGDGSRSYTVTGSGHLRRRRPEGCRQGNLRRGCGRFGLKP